MSQRLLLFGRGGFCLQSARKFKEGPVDLLLDFQADQRRVQGRGVIRWTCHPEPEIGVEIMYIAEDNRAWILGLTTSNDSLSFIPRTTAIPATPATQPESAAVESRHVALHT